MPEIHVRRDADGVPYMIKAGYVRGDKGRSYFVSTPKSRITKYGKMPATKAKHGLMEPATQEKK